MTLNEALVEDLTAVEQALEALNTARKAYHEQKKAVESEYAWLLLNISIEDGKIFVVGTNPDTKKPWGGTLEELRALAYPAKLEPDSKVLPFVH